MKKLVTITTRHWKFLLAFNVIVVLATFVAFKRAKPVWTSTSQLILPKTTSNLDASLGTLGSIKNSGPGFSTEVNPLKIQTSILTSDTLLEKVLSKDPEKEKFKTLSGYKKLFEVTPQEQSTIIALTVSGSSQDIAVQRAQILIDAYQLRLNELRQANSQARLKFSQKELEHAKGRLTKAQINIAGFQQSTGLVSSEEQTRGIVTSINSLSAAQTQAMAASQASAKRAQTLSQRLRLNPSEAIGSLKLTENKEYIFVRNKLSEVESLLNQKQAIFTENHPEVITLQQQRDKLQAQVQEYIAQAAQGVEIDPKLGNEAQGRAALVQQLILAESEANAQRQQAQLLGSQITKLQATFNALPAKQAKLSELQRQVDIAEGVYKGLVAQVQQNNIDAFDAYPNVQVLDQPKVNPSPVSPKVFLMVVNAVLASLIGSIALALFLESRNPLLSAKDLQDQTFAVIERIPRIKNSGIKSGIKFELANENEVEFQRLASAISLQPIENRRMLVSSAITGEGKTTVVMGLAYALVDLGFKVLLVDGDFRKADLSRRLGYTKESNFDTLCITVQPNLDLLPTLPQQRKIVEMIGRGAFEQKLATCEATGNYDYVIVDSAPVTLTSETPLMASIIQNLLFVVRPDTSYKNSVNESFAQLTQHNARYLGLVINGVETKPRSYPYGSNSDVPLVNS
jgi:polysaccharide biosynthesis transport protein